MLDNLTTIQIVYWASALVGGLFFLFRMVLFFVAGDLFDSDINADFDSDIDTHHGDTDVSFKFFSVQGLTAFFMMFGLTGLALDAAGLHTLLTILGGTIAGLFTVWVIGRIFSLMRGLQSEGTLDIKNAVGEIGTVYLTIPKGGTGKVSITVQGALKTFEATAADKNKISTGESVKVVDVLTGNTLVVEES